MQVKTRQTCRICGNPHLIEVIDLGEQYFQGSFVKEGVPNPPFRKTPNLVVRCDSSRFENSCGLIQTKHSIPPEILYTNYWYQSGISSTMRNHLRSIVEKSISITELKQGKVLDIASNDNTLLRNYPSHFVKYGIDPSDIAKKQKDRDITVINDLFPTKNLKEKDFDIVTSIACFYDIEDPKGFAIEIKRILSRKGIWVFEVAYWPSMISSLAYDSIVNEHIVHYHLAPLEIMFKEIGLKIFNAEKTSTNGGSVMVYVCQDEYDGYGTDENKQNLINLRIDEFNAALDEESTYKEFRERVLNQKEELNTLVDTIIKSGKVIHIYGASTKLNTILNFCGIDGKSIEYAAEKSKEKHGARTISGIKIISEEESRGLNPDYYLVGPYHFKEEILEREKDAISRGVKFIFPLPKIEII